MPMTVITISNSPPSLKGDLSKWMQEIDVGVYVGNINTRIRERIWERVKDSVGNGQATISYHSNNEQGYRVETHQTKREITELDGLQLVQIPIPNEEPIEFNKGYSNAAIYRKAKKYSSINLDASIIKKYVILDIETDGLNINKDNIIEIAAIKVEGDKQEILELLVNTGKKLPDNIKTLTGIQDEDLSTRGIPIIEATNKLLEFICELPIIGYNISFDVSFINEELKRLGINKLKNKTYDLLKFIKKDKIFLNSYKLQTVIKDYGMDLELPHRALGDANIILMLATKVNGFLDNIK